MSAQEVVSRVADELADEAFGSAAADAFAKAHGLTDRDRAAAVGVGALMVGLMLAALRPEIAKELWEGVGRPEKASLLRAADEWLREGPA